jgi:hypothetical protein
MKCAMSCTLVHSRKVLIATDQTIAVGEKGLSLPSRAGILAVSIITGIYEGIESELSSHPDTEVLQLQVVSIENIDKDTVSFSIGTENAPISAFSARYTIEQISADLKVFDDSAFQRGLAMTNLTSRMTSFAMNEKIEYFLSLLQSSSSKQEHEIACFMVLDLISGTDPISTTPRLQISIKERLQNGIVRILWSTVMPCLDEANITNCGRKSIYALFQLGLDLSDQYGQVLQKMDALKENHQLLERDRDGWKDTAQKLEGQWEDEKSLLFNNFCTLYSGKKEYDDTRIAELQREIAELKQQLAKASDPGTASTSTVAGKKSVLPDCLQNVPYDDHHRSPYDDETVRRLARGERVPIVAVKTEDSVDTDSYTAIEKQSKKRRNPVSGATEYQDADEALQDIMQSLPDQKKRKGNSSSTQDASSNILEVANAAVKLTRVKDSPRPSSELAADSDTGSDSDFIDKDIQAQIMADLEALRKI